MPRQFGVPEETVQAVMTGRKMPSAYSPYLSPIHQKHVIGVNNAYRIGVWIDVVFFGDHGWYLVHRKLLAKFPGLKVSCHPRFHKRKDTEGIKYLAKDSEWKYGITKDPTKVSWNSNSGAAAISVAAHFGVKKIILLGFDMSLDSGDVSHWHGSHRAGGGKKQKPPPFPRHLRGFEMIAKNAEERGIEIINASPNSAIVELPKVSVADLLNLSKEGGEAVG